MHIYLTMEIGKMSESLNNFGWEIKYDHEECIYYVTNFKGQYCHVCGSLKEVIVWTRKNKITG